MKIWMMNHYATEMFFDKAGRHYWFAQKLKEKGHDTTVFSANTFLNSDDVIDTGNKKYCVKRDADTTFVFVKTPTWSGNGAARVKNWVVMPVNVRLNHAIADGYLVANVFRLLEQEIGGFVEL